MMPALLRKIYAQLDHDDPVHAIFWGICLYAFLLLFRKSNLVPNTVEEFDGRRQLWHADCVVDHIDRKVTVGIRWSKNHQFFRELLTFPLPSLEGSVLCPYAALNNIRKLVPPSSPEEHVFKLPAGGGSFTYRKFHSLLREVLKDVGVENPAEYSSHSFCRGGTTFAFLCGIPMEVIKVLGNWSSDAFLAYLEFTLETRTAACELIKM